jgi:hypothetical protein
MEEENETEEEKETEEERGQGMNTRRENSK